MRMRILCKVLTSNHSNFVQFWILIQHSNVFFFSYFHFWYFIHIFLSITLFISTVCNRSSLTGYLVIMVWFLLAFSNTLASSLKIKKVSEWKSKIYWSDGKKKAFSYGKKSDHLINRDYKIILKEFNWMIYHLYISLNV